MRLTSSDPLYNNDSRPGRLDLYDKFAATKDQALKLPVKFKALYLKVLADIILRTLAYMAALSCHAR